MLCGLVALALEPHLVVAGGAILLASSLTGVGVGAWLGGMVGLNVGSTRLKQFEEAAERLEIPYAIEVLPKSSETDGMATQITAEGIPTFVLSIPVRYMHTPVEMVTLKDIQRAGKLLAEFVSGLEPDFMSTITWDD